jgi:hypothetical protein
MKLVFEKVSDFLQICKNNTLKIILIILFTIVIYFLFYFRNFIPATILIFTFLIIIFYKYYIKYDKRNSSLNTLKLFTEFSSLIWKIVISFSLILIVCYFVPKIFDDKYYIKISDLPVKIVEQGYTKKTIETLFNKQLNAINKSIGNEKKYLISSEKLKLEFYVSSIYLNDLTLVLKRIFNTDKVINLDIRLDSDSITSSVNVVEKSKEVFQFRRHKMKYNNNFSYNIDSLSYLSTRDALLAIEPSKIIEYTLHSENSNDLNYMLDGQEFMNYHWYTKTNYFSKFDILINYSSFLIRNGQFLDARTCIIQAEELIPKLDFSKEKTIELLNIWSDIKIDLGDAKEVLDILEKFEAKSLNFSKGKVFAYLDDLDKAKIYLTKENNNSLSDKKSKVLLNYINLFSENYNGVIENYEKNDTENSNLLAIAKDFKGIKFEDSGIADIFNIKPNEQINLLKNLNEQIYYYDDLKYLRSFYNTSQMLGLRIFVRDNNLNNISDTYRDLIEKEINTPFLDLLYTFRLQNSSINHRYSNYHLKIKDVLKNILNKVDSEFIKFLLIEELRLNLSNKKLMEEISFKSNFLNEYKKLCLLEIENKLTVKKILDFFTQKNELQNLRNELTISFIRELDKDYTKENIQDIQKIKDILLKIRPEPGMLIYFGSILEKFNLKKEADMMYVKGKTFLNHNEIGKPFEILIAEQNSDLLLFKEAFDKYVNHYEKIYRENKKNRGDFILPKYPYLEEMLNSYYLDLGYSTINKKQSINLNKYKNGFFSDLPQEFLHHIKSKFFSKKHYENEAKKLFIFGNPETAVEFLKLSLKISPYLIEFSQLDIDKEKFKYNFFKIKIEELEKKFKIKYDLSGFIITEKFNKDQLNTIPNYIIRERN